MSLVSSSLLRNETDRVEVYFERVHPIYPFLDRAAFEAAIKEDGFQDKIRTNRAWSALYHCVLALGCQHDGGGSFEPASGQAWKLFSKSLALYPDLLGLPDSLLTVQALTAMAIYSSGLSCLSIEYLVISEAARRIQRHVRTSVVGNTANSLYRTFWVLYSMEKVSSFYLGRSSVCARPVLVMRTGLTPAVVRRPRHFMPHTFYSRRPVRRVRLVPQLCTAFTISLSSSDVSLLSRSHRKSEYLLPRHN